MVIRIRKNLSRVLDRNALLMALMALVFSYLYSFTGDEMEDLTIFQADGALWQTYMVLFVLYSSELSKSLLLEEKSSKKLEFLLANGLRLGWHIFSHTISLFLAALIVLLPSIILAFLRSENFALLAFLDFVFFCLLYSIIINIRILNTINLNRLRSLQIRMVLLVGLVQGASWGISYLSGSFLSEGILRYFLIFLILIFMVGRFSKERLVQAYY